MSPELSVLGIDLASRSWQDNGSAIVAFSLGEGACWKSVECGCVTWPTSELSASVMARTIEQTVAGRGIAAVSLDGPQGWREPNAAKRRGVGRVCEYESQCQGKTGEYGKTYPQTQHDWIRFCIEVFSELAIGNAVVANDPDQVTLAPLPDGKFWLLECFPTSTWRTSCLAPLPGKSRVGSNKDLVAAYARSLQQRYGLTGLDPWSGTHDDLQAIVAALPAVGLLKGPCLAVPKGKSGWCEAQVADRPEHWVEGLIWDATLPVDDLAKPVDLPAALPKESTRRRSTSESENPLLIDDRDDSSDSLLGRGVRLFRHLAASANAGRAIGVGYAQLVCFVHGVDDFQDVTKRQYSQSDTAHVLRFAQQITEENDGPIPVTRDGVTIDAAMDAFVWRKKPPHDRPPRAFESAPYSQEQWRQVFPDGERRLLETRAWKAMESAAQDEGS